MPDIRIAFQGRSIDEGHSISPIFRKQRMRATRVIAPRPAGAVSQAHWPGRFDTPHVHRTISAQTQGELSHE